MFVTLKQQNTDAVEQGSDAWFKKRKHKMTGSKPSSIMFECKDEASYFKMWDKVFGEAPPEKFDERQQAAVDWGSNMEDPACEQFYKTMPGTIVYETSIIDHPTYDWIAASPDGYIVRIETNEDGSAKRPFDVIERAAFEIKCPGSHLRDNEGKPMPLAMAKNLMKKKNPPYYYITQVHFEMIALGTPITYFYMWTPWYSKVWKIHFDHSYWEETMAVLSAFRHKEVPWNILESKINAWKNTSQAIARQYTPIHEWKHAPSEDSFVEKKNEIVQTFKNMPETKLITHSWYSQEEKNILKTLFPKMHE